MVLGTDGGIDGGIGTRGKVGETHLVGDQRGMWATPSLPPADEDVGSEYNANAHQQTPIDTPHHPRPNANVPRH